MEAEDILWQRAGKKDKMREGMQRGGSDDEHGAGERGGGSGVGRVAVVGRERRDPRGG